MYLNRSGFIIPVSVTEPGVTTLQRKTVPKTTHLKDLFMHEVEFTTLNLFYWDLYKMDQAMAVNMALTKYMEKKYIFLLNFILQLQEVIS